MEGGGVETEGEFVGVDASDPYGYGEADGGEGAGADGIGGVLPPDVEEVWGDGRLDGSGFVAADTARFLIEQWGVDAFRVSMLHRMAVLEHERSAGLNPLRAVYLKEKRDPGKKRSW